MDLGTSWTIGDEDTVVDGVRVLFFSDAIAGSNFFADMIAADLAWAFGSIVFVLCVLIYHTESAFLGGCGMGQILLSLPCALFWYRTVFGIEFITQMHVLSIYLVLGIGAGACIPLHSNQGFFTCTLHPDVLVSVHPYDACTINRPF